MEEWVYNGVTYQLNSMYLVGEDTWTYELTGPHRTSRTVAGLAVVIPDRTPDGEQLTPSDATGAYVTADEEPLPWPVLWHFIHFVEASGDIMPGSPTVIGDLALSLNSWRFAKRVFEVTSYYDGEHDGWCYELYEVDSTKTSNNYIDVRIPDLQPAAGPFVPAAARHVTLTGHGSLKLPWPVVRHFLGAILAGGGFVEDQK